MSRTNTPGFTAEAALYAPRVGDRYIMQFGGSVITGEVVPQRITLERCLRFWRRVYIGCRLDGGGIDGCTYDADLLWDAAGCNEADL